MKIKLIITDDEGRRNSVPFLRDEISAGRGEGNTIRLPERNVSRKHAVLSREGDEVYIEDLDSYNGVILNGNRIARRTHFFPGDLLQIGDFSIELEISEDEALEKVEIDQESLLEARHIMEERSGDTQNDIVRMKDEEEENEKAQPEAPKPASRPQATPEAETLPRTQSQPVKTAPPEVQPAQPAPAKIVQTAKPRIETKTQTTAQEKPAPKAATLPVQSALRPEVRRPTPEKIAIKTRVTAAPEHLEAEEDNDNYSGGKPGGGRGKLWAGLALAGIAAIAVGIYVSDSTPEKSTGSLPIEPIKKIEVQNRQINIDELLPQDEKIAGDNAEEKSSDPSSPEINAALEEARRLMAAQLWREAEKVLSGILESAPTHTEVRSLRETARAEQENRRNYTEGMRHFGLKDFLMAYMVLGQIDSKSLYFEKSVKHRDLAKTNMLNDYVKSGWVDYKNGKFDRAMNAAVKALNVDPAWTDALELKEQCEEALKSAPPKKEEDPYNARQHYRLGVSNFQKKNFDEAIQHFLAATRLDPEYALAYRAMGSSYASVGDMDRAMLSYRKYVKLDPDSPDAEDVKKIIEEYQNKEKQ